MTVWEAFFLGLIQGLTEFLPVSSSGHLVLFSRVTGTQSSLLFDLVVHCATLIAVVIVYFSDVKSLVRHPLQKPMRLLLAATAMTVGVGLILKGTAESMLSGAALPWCFLATAVILAAGGFFGLRRKRPASPIGYLDALVIGGVQGIAVLPGLSRSGLTLSSANLLTGKHEGNAAFCFMLSIPVILGSTLLELITGEMTAVPFLPLLTGFITAFISGFIALKALKRYLKRGVFTGFSVYLTLLSLFLILNDFIFQLF